MKNKLSLTHPKLLKSFHISKSIIVLFALIATIILSIKGIEDLTTDFFGPLLAVLFGWFPILLAFVICAIAACLAVGITWLIFAGCECYLHRPGTSEKRFFICTKLIFISLLIAGSLVTYNLVASQSAEKIYYDNYYDYGRTTSYVYNDEFFFFDDNINSLHLYKLKNKHKKNISKNIDGYEFTSVIKNGCFYYTSDKNGSTKEYYKMNLNTGKKQLIERNEYNEVFWTSNNKTEYTVKDKCYEIINGSLIYTSGEKRKCISEDFENSIIVASDDSHLYIATSEFQNFPKERCGYVIIYQYDIDTGKITKENKSKYLRDIYCRNNNTYAYHDNGLCIFNKKTLDFDIIKNDEIYGVSNLYEIDNVVFYENGTVFYKFDFSNNTQQLVLNTFVSSKSYVKYTLDAGEKSINSVVFSTDEKTESFEKYDF